MRYDQTEKKAIGRGIVPLLLIVSLILGVVAGLLLFSYFTNAAILSLWWS